MKRCRPPLYSVLALWLSCTLSASAQEFYIELRGPDTPAAQGPAPATPEPSAPTPAQATRYGPVTATDTLWSIAARYTRAPATVQQTMMALYYLNPNAFVRGNINYLQRGAVLRLPTLTQARQRSPQEAQAEFRRLSSQGNRSATRASADRTPAPPAPATQAPVVASPPVVKPEQTKAPEPEAKPAPQPAEPAAPEPKPKETAEPKAAAQPAANAPSATDDGLSAPRAANTPALQAEDAPSAAPSRPEEAEQAALQRLQARLLDELREQVAMSNEQLAQLADNNQALRRRLGQLTAEVNELKMVRAQQLPAESATQSDGNWLSDLLKQPLNLALLLTLPALLLLALFTLWWRNRTRKDLDEQDQASSELMMEDENSDFDDLFAADLSTPHQETSPEQQQENNGKDELEIDEDAFARFLEEQQRQEEEPTPEPQTAAAASEVAFDDKLEDTLFDDDMLKDDAEPAFDDNLEDVLFDDEAADRDEEMTAGRNEPSAAPPELDEDLFDLNESKPDEEPAVAEQPEPRTEPSASPRGNGAEQSGAFDEILAESMAGQESATEASVADELAGVLGEREPVARQELDDYADLLGNGQEVDIDLDEGGVGAKLDLARAYIEIDDLDSARGLLNEALEQGNEQQQNDARKLLQRLDKR